MFERIRRMSRFYDAWGNYIGPPFPLVCIEECTKPGEDATNACKLWIERLQFAAPRDLAIDYLVRSGGWKREELEALSVEEIDIKVFWMACHDFKENDEYFGLVE